MGGVDKVQRSRGLPSSRPKNFKNNFPVTVKIKTSGYQASDHNSQLFMLYRRLVHVGNTFNRFWAVNCTKMGLANGLRLDPLGSYSAPADPVAVIMGRQGKKGKEWVGKRKGRKGRT